MKEDRALLIKDIIIASLDRDKAEDVEIIDLEGKTDFASFAVIASGRADRHVAAMAEKMADDLKASGLLPGGVHIEGLDSKQWVLVDADEVIVHIFLPEVRQHYDLTKLYAKWGVKSI